MSDGMKVSIMDSLRRGIRRLGAFFRKEPLDRDLDAEMKTHLELAVEENMSKGMPWQEAKRQALIRFGGVAQAKERHRESRGIPGLEVLLQDLRYTMRTLGRDRGFATVAILILALGIGANVVVFSVVNTILLRPLPFYDPSRLVWIAPENAKGMSASTYSADAYDDLRSMNRSYEDVTGYFAFSSPDNIKLTGRGVPQPITGIGVAGNFFHLLGVSPFLGRQFTEEETRKGGPAAVMLSYPFWQKQFNGDRSLVGSTIEFDKKPVTVVGVLPESFDFGAAFSPGSRVDVLTPVVMDDIRYWGNTLTLIGRLKPGVTLEQSRSEARTLFPQLYWSKRSADSKNQYTAYPVSLKDYISGKLRRSLIVLWSAVALILLIVCVNLSNLMLSRAAARSKEFALRAALGAGRGRLIRQLMTESLVLSFTGSALGLALAYGLLRYLAHQGSIALPLLNEVRLDGMAFVWTCAITLLTAVLFGVIPAFRASRTSVQEALKDGGHGTTEGRQHEKMRTVLVVSEVALACVLLVGAGLLLRSFLRVLEVDLGFQPATAASMQVDYDDEDHLNVERRSATLRNIADHVASLPGVESVGFTDNLPLARNRGWGAPRIKGKTYKEGELPETLVYIISPGYIKAMGIRVRGREFTWADTDHTEGAVILNESAAKGLFPNEDPVGKMVVAGGRDGRIVGVIPNVADTSVEGKASWQMYLSMSQKWGPSGINLVVRSKTPPEQLGGSVLRTLREINPNQPAVEFRPLQQLVNHAVSPRQFFMLLVGAFAGMGLLLAALGIYGVISYSVTRRTQEIGVRMALGASPAHVQRGVLAKTLQMAGIGVAVGAGASLILAGLIASLLYGTTPTDPVTFVAISLLLTAVAALAGYIPARRASRINPMVALRNE